MHLYRALKLSEVVCSVVLVCLDLELVEGLRVVVALAVRPQQVRQGPRRLMPVHLDIINFCELGLGLGPAILCPVILFIKALTETRVFVKSDLGFFDSNILVTRSSLDVHLMHDRLLRLDDRVLTGGELRGLALKFKRVRLGCIDVNDPRAGVI